MSTALWPLQVAIVQALRADATLTGLITAVHDEVPEPAPFPYVSLGSVTEQPDDNHGQRGIAAAVVLHIWSTYRGNRECAQILAALDALLDRRALTVPGWKDISVAHQQAEFLRDPDPDIRHVNVRYRVWMTKT